MSEQKNYPIEQSVISSSHELAIPEPGSVEYDFPYAEIPQGGKDREGNIAEPSDEQLKEFFTPEMISRLVYCSRINVDLLDDWGISGYQPGYIFVCDSNYKGAESFNDAVMLNGGTFDNFTTENDYNILRLKGDHYDSFPRNKFKTQIITADKTPKTFNFLRHLLDGVDVDDLSTYPIEDINYLYKNLYEDKVFQDERTKQIKEFESMKSGGNINNSRLEETVNTLKNSIQKLEQESPEKTLKRLKITEEIQRRGLNPELKFFPSFEEEEISINKDIELSRLNGNNQLVEEISSTFQRVEPLLKNNQKQLTEE